MSGFILLSLCFIYVTYLFQGLEKRENAGVWFVRLLGMRDVGCITCETAIEFHNGRIRRLLVTWCAFV